MTEEPLFIDTDAVRAGGNEMLSGIESLTAPAVFTPPTGSDPLSVRITAELPFAEGPIVLELPAIKADGTKTANNVVDAANRYEQADQLLGRKIEQAQIPGANGAPGAGGAGAAPNAGAAQAAQAGQMGQMGQLMGMPMQMAQQAAQLPMQAIGMAAALPQGLMQGVQAAMQQVSQLGGQADSSGEDALKDQASADEAQRAEYANEEPQADPDKEQGAKPAQPGAERAPQTGGTGESPSQTAPPAPPRTPAPTRPAEADEGINL